MAQPLLRYEQMIRTLLIILALLLSPSLLCASAAKLHHVYVGIYGGSDETGQSSGGWDNDASYSVDRAMVDWQGKNFAFEQTYINLDGYTDESGAVNAPFNEFELMWYYGRVPVVNLSYDNVRPAKCNKTLTALVDNLNASTSADYQHLVWWARGVNNWLNLGGKRFLMVAFQQEANYNTCATTSDSSTYAFGDPVAFKSAFRQVRAIVSSALGDNASRVHWVFAPNCASSEPFPDFEAYYPGDGVVDWAGMSAYNFGGYRTKDFTAAWQGFDEMARPYLDRLRALAPRKPLALLQLGSISFGGDKNLWLKDFLLDAMTYPKLYLVVYFNSITKGEGGIPAGLDWPVFWNDPYDARPDYNVNFGRYQMRYAGWLEALASPYLTFSNIPMPPSGSFERANWDIRKTLAPVSSLYNLVAELRNREGDSDNDGVANWREFESGLDPLVADALGSETDCQDGVDNDANGRTDADDTVWCGGLALVDGEIRFDHTLPPSPSPEERHFQFSVPAGSARSVIRVEVQSGNASVYVRKGERPTRSVYDFKSTLAGTTRHVIELNRPGEGQWYVMVYGLEASSYTIEVSNVVIAVPHLDAARDAIACDVDGNGMADLIFSIGNSGVQAFLNSNKWVDLLTSATYPSSLACGDIDGNGMNEVIGSWPSSNALKVFAANTWTWRDVVDSPFVPDVVLAKDVDGDGIAELVGYSVRTNSLFIRWGGTGRWETFPSPAGTTPQRFLSADLNGDGVKEIIGLWRDESKFMYRRGNDWVPISLPVGVSKTPDLVEAGDFDNDGIADLVAVWRNSYFTMQVRSGATGQWTEMRRGTYIDAMPSIVAVADVDGDRKDDIVMTWDAWKTMHVYLQSWRATKLIYAGVAPIYVVADNFDNDGAGRQDITLIWGNNIMIWENNASLKDVQRFTDVSLDYWAYPYVDVFATSGVTSGCALDDPGTPINEARYCPESNVTRAQMAIFLMRALGQLPGVCNGAVFRDVTRDTFGCEYIEKFATFGITSGCGNGNFCPNDPVTRTQMAVFITKALGQLPGVCNGAVFRDVTRDTFGCEYIEKFATLGITSGCGNSRFCPSDNVTRAQMAVFLTRAFLQ